MQNIDITKTPNIVTQLLATLPLRQRDVLYKRFGLKNGKRKTLEEIGTGYHITRERVRQIENDAKASILQSDPMKDLDSFFEFMTSHFKQYGGVRVEHKLFEEDAPLLFPNLSKRNLPKAYMNFLLSLHSGFSKYPESENFHIVWVAGDKNHEDIKTYLNDLVAELESTESLVEKEELFTLFKKFTGEIAYEILESHLHISKNINMNVFGEYGLKHWPEINTRGVRDKAYVVLKKHGEPLHFREIVNHINEIFSQEDKKKAHPQTVHNELIKNDKFILVGRGMYALSDWGYQPGRVLDVILRVLKEAGSPLSKEDIVDAVLKERDVKLNTILLNLQNKKYFEKIGEEFTFKN